MTESVDPSDLIDLALAALALAMAVWTVVARDHFAAIVGFVTYGLALALIWVRLDGVDVALTEAAIGSGLTGALMLRAASRLRAARPSGLNEKPGRLIRLVAALLASGIAVTVGIAVTLFPDPAPSLAIATRENIDATGVKNPLTAVLLAFRAMDTLLEAIVVLFALIGVWSLAPNRAWGGRPGTVQLEDPEGPLAFLARVLVPLGIIIGVYIFWIGADEPGGKFQGAAIIAAMWLLAYFAGLTEAPVTHQLRLRLALITGPIIFLAVGAAGVLTAGAFLGYPEGLAKPLIIVIEWALFPSLAVALALIVMGSPMREER